MLDQTFSAQNFRIIFDIENRKGNIDINNMPKRYSNVVKQIKTIKQKIKDIAILKVTKARNDRKEKLESSLKEKEAEKEKVLVSYMLRIQEKVASPKFNFTLIEKEYYDGKKYYEIDKDKDKEELFYAIKQLQYNIRKTFKVKQANRHTILSNIKVLLNSKIPVYVIRTDISKFYESIDQDKLLKIIDNNTLLSHKSKSFVHEIIDKYNNTKEVPLSIGIPRGVGISAYLSELYMRDLDDDIRKRREVIFYARYVDDIFIILSDLSEEKDIESYYDKIIKIFFDKGLELKQPENSKKCKLIDPQYKNGKNDCNKIEMDYLGYKLNIEKSPKGGFITTYSLSDHKQKSLYDKINKAFKHFKDFSACNIKQARRDLLDSINYISGNTRLYKSKSGVKVGLYYNNDLLDKVGEPSESGEFSGLGEYTTYLKGKEILFHPNLWKDDEAKDKFIRRLSAKIDRVDFVERWKERKMFSFSMKRLEEIGGWLYEEKKEK